MTSTLPTLRVAAVGDSLTKGYLTFFTTHPYTDVLKAQGIMVSNFGVSGALTQEMKRQMKRVVAHRSDDPAASSDDDDNGDKEKALERKSRRIPYKYVVILGGTNDLGCDLLPETVLENLEEFASMAAAAGIFPFLVTVPPLGKHIMTDETVSIREQVNAGLRRLCDERQFGLIDLFGAVVDESAPFLRENLTGDQLHLNEKGYDLMGDIVFEAIASHFEANQGK